MEQNYSEDSSSHETTENKKLKLLHNSLQESMQMVKIFQTMKKNIFENFHVELSSNVDAVTADIESLSSLYALLQARNLDPRCGYFALLPVEIIIHILRSLPASDLARFGRTNTELKQISEETSLWKRLCDQMGFLPFWSHDTKTLQWKNVYQWYAETNKEVDASFVKSTADNQEVNPVDVEVPSAVSSSAVALSGNSPVRIRGKFKFENSLYKGEWLNGYRDGYGIHTWQDGDVYKGSWVADKRCGFGKHSWPDGHYYEGQYDDDKRNGKGVFVWPDNRRYEGNYLDDQRNGFGEFTWPNGDRYIGYYQRSDRNGEGIFIWADGRRYAGSWKNGGYHGYGEYTHKDGCRYIGEWKENNRSGQGVFYWTDGNHFMGTWESGRRHGKGLYFNVDPKTHNVVDTIEQDWDETKFDKSNRGPGIPMFDEAAQLESISKKRANPDRHNNPNKKVKLAETVNC